LRRTFADFSQFDRQRLLSLARGKEEKEDLDAYADPPSANLGAAAGAENVKGKEDILKNKPEAEKLVDALLDWMG